MKLWVELVPSKALSMAGAHLDAHLHGLAGAHPHDRVEGYELVLVPRGLPRGLCFVVVLITKFQESNFSLQLKQSPRRRRSSISANGSRLTCRPLMVTAAAGGAGKASVDVASALGVAEERAGAGGAASCSRSSILHDRLMAAAKDGGCGSRC